MLVERTLLSVSDVVPLLEAKYVLGIDPTYRFARSL